MNPTEEAHTRGRIEVNKPRGTGKWVTLMSSNSCCVIFSMKLVRVHLGGVANEMGALTSFGRAAAQQSYLAGHDPFIRHVVDALITCEEKITKKERREQTQSELEAYRG